MAKSQMQKAKLLYILDMLRRETDENHALTTKEIIERLAAEGIHAERKTIYADMEELVNYGYDIISRDTRNGGGYYLASREFELAELKLLVDAVQATRFITERKSRELIGKIESLTSKHEAVRLQRQVYVAGRSKAENESIYYSVDAIHRAIQSDCKLEFQYLKWTPGKKLEPRREGKIYQVSPWALLWQEENYYLAAYDEEAQTIKHFRVDKMGSVSVTKEKRLGREYFEKIDVAKYSSQTFGMFGGDQNSVTLEMKEALVGVILDRFGKEISVIKKSEDLYRVRVEVAVSQQFYGWLTGLGSGIQIAGPKEVKDDYKKYLLDTLKNYEEE